MLPFLPSDVPHEVLDFGLHINPTELKKVLQEKIDEASPKADVLLLGYGLCSMAVVGLKATTATLVIPRTDDCIAIFLGSCAAYKEQAKKEPGTYYLTKGWIEVGDTPFEEHKLLIEKYGEEKAERMTHLLLNLRFEEIDGSPALVKKMVFGPWDEEFVVVSPGETVSYKDFANHKKDPKDL